MKKTALAIALAIGFSTVSHGSAILWSVDTAAIRDFTVSGETITEQTTKFLSGAKLYFFLGTTTAEAVESAFEGTELKTSALSTYLATDVSNNAGGRAAGTTPAVHANISSSSANDFFLVITAVKDGDAYYKLVSGSATGYETSGDPLPPTTVMNFARNSVQSSSWTAVPEPSTAMLALAGLALLIKRRKA